MPGRSEGHEFPELSTEAGRNAPAQAVPSADLIPGALFGDRFGPSAAGEGGDALGHLHKFVPGITTPIENGLVGVPDTVAEKVAAQELPDIFDWVQLRRVGW
jgi:hypothetical protein